MKTVTTILAAGIMTSAAFAGSAFAGEEKVGYMEMVRTVSYDDQQGQTGYGYQPGFLTRMADETGVHIRSLDTMPRAEAAQFKSQSHGKVGAFQEKLRKNTNVVGALTARNLKISDVIGVQRAADGSAIYITR